MRILIAISLTYFAISLQAQGISINGDSTPPHESAILDVSSSTKGVLLPRMLLSERDLIANPTTGLLLFQTDDVPGYYAFTGASWQRLPNATEVWGTAGNAATDPNANFFGTLDSQPVRFRLNNNPAGELNHITGNLMIGDSSGMVIQSSHSNTSYGHRSFAALTTGNRNVAIGFNALRALQSGGHNIGIGYNALRSTINGEQNIAIGSYALEKNTSGAFNLCVGSFSLTQNTTAVGNTAIGHFVMSASSTGSYNTAVGLDALSGNVSGHSNTAMGAAALISNTTGHNNLALGRQALNTNTMGEFNIALGTEALSQNTTGNYNIAIGFGTGVQAANLYNTVGISNNGSLHNLHNRIHIGNASHTWTGGNVTWSTYSDARIKRNVSDDVKGLEFIHRLRPVTYYRDVDAQAELTGDPVLPEFPHKYDIEFIKFSGFLAQEVAAAADASGYDFSGIDVPETPGELYSLSYEAFVVPLVKAVQEQQAMIESQQLAMQTKDDIIQQLNVKMNALIEAYLELETRVTSIERQPPLKQ